MITLLVYFDPDERDKGKIFMSTLEAFERDLDLCTGTGFSAFKTAEAFPSSSIDAIDQITEMLDIAQKKAQESGINNIHFKIGNAAKLNYENTQFDLITTSNAPIYLSEAARVLKSKWILLAVYSFSGDAFVSLKVNITKYLYNYGIALLEIKNKGSGVYILGQKVNNGGV